MVKTSKHFYVCQVKEFWKIYSPTLTELTLEQSWAMAFTSRYTQMSLLVIRRHHTLSNFIILMSKKFMKVCCTVDKCSHKYAFLFYIIFRSIKPARSPNLKTSKILSLSVYLFKPHNLDAGKINTWAAISHSLGFHRF
jgi:hypothetical protein